MTWLQQWTDVLFLHFAIAADELEPHLPPQLEIDTFDSQAWLSFIFFRLKLRPVGVPFIPGLSSLLEMNVRTYVRHRGQPGIYFLRMYADNWLAIQAARLLTPLCYEHATMIDLRLPDAQRHVECWPAGDRSSGLSVDFTIAGDATEVCPGSLDFWLVERYRLFVGRHDGAILAGDVEHPSWQVSAVDLSVLNNHIGEATGLPLGEAPSAASFSTGVAARFNSFGVVAGRRNMRTEYSVRRVGKASEASAGPP